MQSTVTQPQQRSEQMPMIPTPWVNFAVGIAAIITPFVGSAPDAFRTSNVITGIIICIVALLAFFSSRSRSGIYVAIINVLAGIWLLISTSFTLSPAMVWDNVILGVLAIVTACVSMGVHKQVMGLRGLL